MNRDVICQRQMLTDNSKIDFGRYAGTQLIHVPAHYLLWLYENKIGSPELRLYLKNKVTIRMLYSKI